LKELDCNIHHFTEAIVRGISYISTLQIFN
jgi:hypothetical protein